MFTIKIWFRHKHDDYCVFEIYKQPNPVEQVKELVKEGGFWMGDKFIPFHCISTIEQIEETEHVVTNEAARVLGKVADGR